MAGVALGAGLSVLAVEGGLRVIAATPLWRVLPVIQPILGRPDRDVGYDYTPGARGIWPREHRSRVRISSQDLRDVERDIAKPPGETRIGLLGDSLVEALQVDQRATFGAIAERTLRAQGHDVELINLGMSGAGPLRQLLRLEKHGYAFHLDAVVAFPSVGDFQSGELLDDSLNPGYVEAADGTLKLGYAFRARFAQRHADDVMGRVFLTLLQDSPVFRELYLRAKQPPLVLLGLKSQSFGGAFRPEGCAATDAQLEHLASLWIGHEPARDWAATSRVLDDLAESAAAHKVRVIYAVRGIPFAPRSCPDAAARRGALVSAIAKTVNGRGMHFVDWAAAVADVAGGPAEMWRLTGFGPNVGNGHLNYEGHRAWARALEHLAVSDILAAPAAPP